MATQYSKLKLLIHLVSFNNEKTIVPCIQSLLQQKNLSWGEDYKIILSDNCSQDKTVSLVESNFSGKVEIIKNDRNLGFCTAHNVGATIAMENEIEFLFIVNPDLRLEENALNILLQNLEKDKIAGVCCPKLYRADENLNPISPPTFDSSGMYITPEIRHFDRGSNEEDKGQYEKPEYVFGASGAAMLLRREFIKDVSLEREYLKNSLEKQKFFLFDPNFFAYREDADLAWRMQWLGWKCRYQPTAIGYHQRKVLPQRRAELESEINAYGVRNRFLLQFNNFSWKVNFCQLPWILSRNLLVILAVSLKEKSSRAALRTAWQLFTVCRRNHYLISCKRRVPFYEIKKWFSFKPYSEPALSFKKTEDKIKKITAIIVNYNSGERLAGCLKHLNKAIVELNAKYQIQIAIFDNDSGDQSISKLKPLIEELPQFELIESKVNQGFAGAINRTARQFASEAFLILNPDIIIEAPALEKLITSLQEYPELAAISPVLKNNKGAIQSQYLLKNFPNFSSTLAELFLWNHLFPENIFTQSYDLSKNNLFLKYLLQIKDGSSPQYDQEKPLLIPQPAAACLLIRANDFNLINGFDETFWPAWFEDVDFCKRLFALGKYCAIDSRAEVIHEGGYSLNHMDKSNFYRIWYTNLIHYWKKHGTRLEYCTIRFLLPFSLLIKSCIFFFKACISREKIYLNSAKGLFSMIFLKLETKKH